MADEAAVPRDERDEYEFCLDVACFSCTRPATTEILGTQYCQECYFYIADEDCCRSEDYDGDHSDPPDRFTGHFCAWCAAATSGSFSCPNCGN